MMVFFDFKAGGDMKAITIRGLDPDLAENLKSTAKKQGKSINQLTIDLLKAGLGLIKAKKYSREYDDLDGLFGQWSDEEFNAVESKIASERCVDSELWR